MANIEKHPKHPMEQVERAGFSSVPTRARAPRVIGQYIKNRRNDGRLRVPAESGAQAAILRFDDLPASPKNLERIHERVRILNRLLADSGTPLRLRILTPSADAV